MVDTYTLTRIPDDVTAEGTLPALNAPIAQAEKAQNELSSRLDSLNSKSAVLRYAVPINSDVTAGMLVYYNTGDSKFEPAVAALLGTPGDQGQSVEAPSSRVEGMIISKDASGITGTMLTGGYWESATLAAACLGGSATAGTYYLSPETPGKAAKNTNGHLQQPVLSYYGNGKFSLSLFYMAHDNHFHGSAVLTGSWQTASSLADVEIPDGAQFVYNSASDRNFIGLGELSARTTAQFYNGELMRDGIDNSGFVVQDGYIWCGFSAPPDPGSVTVFNHFPFAYNSPVVRSIESTSTALTVRNRNGLIQLTPNAFISSPATKQALAISAIADNILSFTPVVTEVAKGPGITLTKSVDGTVVVSASNLVGTPVDAESINHNGTAVTSDGIFQYITFPNGRSCGFTMQRSVSDVPAGATLHATAWGTVAGVGSVFNVSMYFVPQPTAGAPVNMPSGAQETSTLTIIGAAGKLTFAETPDYIEFSGDGTLVAVVELQSEAATDINMFRAGFRITVASSGSSSSSGLQPMEKTEAVTNKMISGCAATQYQLLKAVEGKLQICTSTLADDANTCIGIALAGCVAGEVLEFISYGILQNSNFNWTAGLPLYISENGTLTQADLSADNDVKYVQRVGLALTEHALQISIEPAVVK